MTGMVRIGCIGDFDPGAAAHLAIPAALRLAAGPDDIDLEIDWLPTGHLPDRSQDGLAIYDGLWCAPGAPYAGRDATLRAIRWARERSVPFLGTCAGFQHGLIEYARNVLGIAAAASSEDEPGTTAPVVAPLARTLVDATGRVAFEAGSRVREMYGAPEATEQYFCRYGLNPDYETRFGGAPFRIAGRDRDGGVHAFELDRHPFFVATLYQPERSADTGRPHPLVRGFLAAARARHAAIDTARRSAASSD